MRHKFTRLTRLPVDKVKPWFTKRINSSLSNTIIRIGNLDFGNLNESLEPIWNSEILEGLYRNHLLWAVWPLGWNWAVSCRKLSWADGIKTIWTQISCLNYLKVKNEQFELGVEWAVGYMVGEQLGIWWWPMWLLCQPQSKKLDFGFFQTLSGLRARTWDLLGQGIGTWTWAWQLKRHLIIHLSYNYYEKKSMKHLKAGDCCSFIFISFMSVSEK